MFVALPPAEWTLKEWALAKSLTGYSMAQMFERLIELDEDALEAAAAVSAYRCEHPLDPRARLMIERELRRRKRRGK